MRTNQIEILAESIDAKNYSNKKHTNTLITMFIKQDEVKILENTYLEKIKNTIIEKHFDEFGAFSNKDNEYYIFDNLQKFVNEYFSEVYKKIDTLEKLGLPDEEFFKKQKEHGARLKKDPTFKKLYKNRKKYYTSAKAYVWFNSGLLIKLMKYDVLHTKEYLRDFYTKEEDEYLVVNPKILHVLIS